MEALLAILLFTGVLAGVAAAFRVAENRAASQKSASNQRERSLTPDRQPVPPAPTISQARAAETLPQPTSTVEQATASVQPQATTPIATTPVIAPPMVPDPWLAKSEDAAPNEPVANPPMAQEPSPVPEPPSSATLSAAIASMGQSGQAQQIANLLRYVNHGDSEVRVAVATALGNIAANKPGKSMESIIPSLGNLSQDTKPAVRLAAVEALGNIQSTKVLPWLQQAQKTGNADISKAVTVALQRLKLTYQPKSKFKSLNSTASSPASAGRKERPTG